MRHPEHHLIPTHRKFIDKPLQALEDRHGQPLTVGCQVRYQRCSGRYGQTSTMRGEVLAFPGDYPYGVCLKILESHRLEGSSDGRVATRYLAPGDVFTITSPIRMRPGQAALAHHVHHDFEHGHETFLEITGWHPDFLPKSLSGPCIKALAMQQTAAVLALALGITQDRAHTLMEFGTQDEDVVKHVLVSLGKAPSSILQSTAEQQDQDEQCADRPQE